MTNKYKESKSQYSKNLRRSIKHMTKELAKTAMPSLTETVVSAQESYRDIKDFALKSKSRIQQQNAYNKRTLLKPVTEIINNAKEDIKTGKFYNEDRENEQYEESMSMSEFLDYGYDETETNNDPGMSSYKNFLATTSAGSMANARAIAETQTATTEYLGELYQTTNIQNNMLMNKYHKEVMSKLNNMQNLAGALVDFNLNVVKDHIKTSHEFYQTMVDEVHTLNKNVANLANSLDNRFGNNKKRRINNDLDDIFGSGAFNIKSYGDIVKRNLANNAFLDKDMLKMFMDNIKTSPISAIGGLVMSNMFAGSKAGKTASKIDRAAQGIFAKYLSKMGDWRDGNVGKYKGGTMGDILQFLGGVLAPSNISNSKGKPNLSFYKDQAITLQLEQKKAKAITEVIPTYLRTIAAKITGRDMTFDYDRGSFLDTKDARREAQRDINRRMASSSPETREYLMKRAKAYSKSESLDSVSEDMLKYDVDAFIVYLSNSKTSSIKYEPSKHNENRKMYDKLTRDGLRLRGGYESYKILNNFIASSSSIKRGIMDSEILSANGVNSFVAHRINEALNDSGKTALFNGFDVEDSRSRSYRTTGGKAPKGSGLYRMSEKDLEDLDLWYKREKAMEEGKDPNSVRNKGERSTKAKSFLSKYDRFGIGKILSKISGGVAAIDDFGSAFLTNISDRIFGAPVYDDVIYAEESPRTYKSSFKRNNRKYRVPVRNVFTPTESNLDHSQSHVVNSDKFTRRATSTVTGNPSSQGSKGSTTNEFDILKAIGSGIMGAGGSASTYFNSDSFKNLLSGMKNKIDGGTGKVKSELSGVFDKFKELRKAAGKKGKGMLTGSIVTSMIGLGPVPGAVLGALFTKTDKKQKPKTKEEKDQQKSIEETQKESNKKDYKRTSIIKSSLITSMLGLGPVPGALFGMALNKHKKNKYGTDKNDNTKGGVVRNKAKSIIAAIKGIKKSDEAGKTEQSDRMENSIINKAAASGDVDSLVKTTSIIANVRNSKAVSDANESVNNPKAKKGLFSIAGGLLGNLINSGGIGTVVASILGFFGIKTLKDLLKEMKGDTGHGSVNEYGDSNFSNIYDNAINGVSATGSVLSGTLSNKFIGKGTGFSAFGAIQSLKSASYYSNEAKAYRDRGATTLKQEQQGLVAQNLTKGAWYGSKVAKAASNTKIGKGLVSFITKLTNHPKVIKLIEKIPGKNVAKKLIDAISKNADNIASSIIKHAPKSIASISSKLASFASVVVAWLPIATAVVAFIRGCNNAYRDLSLSPDSHFNAGSNFKMRIANGIIYAIDDVLCGVIDICGLRSKLLDIVTKSLFNGDEERQLQISRDEQKSKYDKFLKDNDLSSEGFTFDMYNKLTNKSIWGNTKSLFGVDDINKYKMNGKKNQELRSKYGGYQINTVEIDSSTNNNIFTSSTGAGARGVSPRYQSSTEIIRNARNSLNSSLGQKVNRVSDEQLNNYSRSHYNDSPRNENAFSRIGGAISGAAKWIVNGVVGGFNWLKGKMTGSGGRGNIDESNYYNQGDPRWANQSFGMYNGKRDTVKAGGCGPTVAAMAMQELSGHQVLPSDMANLAMKAGAKFDDGGTDPSFFNTAANRYGMNATNESGLSPRAIRSIKAGNPVPLMGSGGIFGNGTHYLLANGMDSKGNVRILDPLRRSNNGTYRLSDIRNNTSVSTVFNSASRGRGTGYINAVKKMQNIFGRGYSAPRQSFVNIVKEVKKQFASQKPGYSQSKYINISVNGETLKCRTDCSGFVGTCLKFFGIGKGKNWTSDSFHENGDGELLLMNAGFIRKASGDPSTYVEGDILGYKGHVEVFAYLENGKVFVYNCGSNSSCNNPNATPSAYSNGKCIDVWSPDNAVGTGGNLMSSILGKISIKSPLNQFASLLAGSTASAATIGSTSGLSGVDTGKSLSSYEAYKHNPKYYSPVTADSLKQAIRKVGGNNRAIENHVNDIIKIGNELGIDPRWIAANAIGEAGWDLNNSEAKNHNNFFGIDGGGSKIKHFTSPYDGWASGVKWIKDNYLDKGQDSFFGMCEPEKVGADYNHSYTPSYRGTTDGGTKGKVYSSLIAATGGAGGRGNGTPHVRLRSAIGRGDSTSSSPIKIRNGISISRNTMDPARSIVNIPTYSNSQRVSSSDSGFGSKVESLLCQMIDLLASIRDSSEVTSKKDFSPKVIAPQSNGTQMNPGIMQPQAQKMSLYESIVSGI